MTEKRKLYTAEFKREAVRLITEQRYGVAETARNLGINVNMLRRWKQAYAVQLRPFATANSRRLNRPCRRAVCTCDPAPAVEKTL